MRPNNFIRGVNERCQQLEEEKSQSRIVKSDSSSSNIKVKEERISSNGKPRTFGRDFTPTTQQQIEKPILVKKDDLS